MGWGLKRRKGGINNKPYFSFPADLLPAHCGLKLLPLGPAFNNVALQKEDGNTAQLLTKLGDRQHMTQEFRQEREPLLCLLCSKGV